MRLRESHKAASLVLPRSHLPKMTCSMGHFEAVHRCDEAGSHLQIYASLVLQSAILSLRSILGRCTESSKPIGRLEAHSLIMQ
jgi:hypothetical protein